MGKTTSIIRGLPLRIMSRKSGLLGNRKKLSITCISNQLISLLLKTMESPPPLWGRLNTATDRAGGAQTLTRADTADSRGFETTRVSGEGRTTRYRLENTPTGAQQRGVTTPAGLSTTTRKQPDGTRTTVTPDGTTLATVQGPDPRFGMQAPRIAQATITTGGQTATVTTTQTVTPGDPAQPPGITTRTDTVTVNGRATTTVYTTADRSAVTTSPTGRTRTLTLDGQGR